MQYVEILDGLIGVYCHHHSERGLEGCAIVIVNTMDEELKYSPLSIVVTACAVASIANLSRVALVLYHNLEPVSFSTSPMYACSPPTPIPFKSTTYPPPKCNKRHRCYTTCRDLKSSPLPKQHQQQQPQSLPSDRRPVEKPTLHYGAAAPRPWSIQRRR